MSPKSALAALEETATSKGWLILEETMRAEIVEAALQIAANPNLTEKETDFRRGAIWAAKQLLEIMPKLKAKYETELALTAKPLKPSAKAEA